MIWGFSFLLTLAVVLYVGYPLFVREETLDEDVLEMAVAERRRRKQKGLGTANACPSCGAGNDPADRFCGSCGAFLGPRCPRCGARSQQGDAFCASCGAKLTAGGEQ